MKSRQINFRCSTDKAAKFAAAAKAAGLSFSAWLVLVADAAAGDDTLYGQLTRAKKVKAGKRPARASRADTRR